MIKRRLLATSLMVSLFVSAVIPVAQAVSVQPLEPVVFTGSSHEVSPRVNSDNALACTSCGSSVAGIQLAGSVVSDNHNAAVMSDSLIGNLILSMAYQRDPELSKLQKRMRRVDNLTLVSVAAISGLGLAQSIKTLTDLNGGGSTEASHHHDEHTEHATTNTHHDSKTPATLGIVGNGLSLASLGVRAIMSRSVRRKVAARQSVITQQVNAIIDALEADINAPEPKAALEVLIGPRATREVLGLIKNSRL